MITRLLSIFVMLLTVSCTFNYKYVEVNSDVKNKDKKSDQSNTFTKVMKELKDVYILYKTYD
jgi:hypothetical protein